MFKFLAECHPHNLHLSNGNFYKILHISSYIFLFLVKAICKISLSFFFFLLVGIDWQVRPPLSGLPPLGKMSVNKETHFNTSIANLVILRGKDVHSADVGEQS